MFVLFGALTVPELVECYNDATRLTLFFYESEATTASRAGAGAAMA